jgi:hypothetical protein
VRNFRDLTRRGLRFRTGSGMGTRILIDQILADAGIAPADLTGYANEFTHGAVAVTVARWRRCGLRPARGCRRVPADFVSVVRERLPWRSARRKSMNRPSRSWSQRCAAPHSSSTCGVIPAAIRPARDCQSLDASVRLTLERSAAVWQRLPPDCPAHFRR